MNDFVIEKDERQLGILHCRMFPSSTASAMRRSRSGIKAAIDSLHFNGLAEAFGGDVAERIAEWLDYRGGDEEAREQSGETSERAPGANAQLKSARASTFEMSAIQWLWPSRFAIGKLGIIAGLPDEGKGQVLCDMAARVTRGLEWPCDEGVAPGGNVILLSAEDDAKDTVEGRRSRPRTSRDRQHGAR
jgi:hypothetical protein